VKIFKTIILILSVFLAIGYALALFDVA